MDSHSLSGVGILVKDGNCRAMLGLDNAAGCHYGDIGDLMVINSPDIDCSFKLLDDSNVVASYATIGTPVYQ